MQTTETFKNTKDIMSYIATLFPKCFAMKGDVRPLKVGIFQDLSQRLENDEKVTKTQLRSALRYYTSSWHYLHGVKEGAIRVDLDGLDCGGIEAEHIEHARLKLQESKERFYERKKEKEQQQAKDNKDNKDNKATRKPRSATPKKQNARPHADKSRQSASGNKTTAQNNKKTVRNTTPKSTTPLNIAEIQVDQKVNVNMGKGNVAATVLEIKKDDVRVQLANGLQLVVKPTHLNSL